MPDETSEHAYTTRPLAPDTWADFATLVEQTFRRIAAERRLAELYNKWFLRRLPTGETLNLPISPQLEEFFRIIGQPD